MSLPDILVLNRFLDDYLEIRQATWHSTLGIFKKAGTYIFNAGVQFFSNFYRSLPTVFRSYPVPSLIQDDEKVITNISRSIADLFSKAQTINDWVNIIYDLGNQARQAQQRSKDSLFCQTLHAIRTYIISHLQEGDEAKTYIPPNLAQEIYNLEEEIFQKQILNLSVADLEAKRDALLYNLADLDDDRTIFLCRRVGLFNLLDDPDKNDCNPLTHTSNLTSAPALNSHRPWYYQTKYDRIYHDQIIKPIKNESFAEFELRAKRKGKLMATALNASDSKNSNQDKAALTSSLEAEPSLASDEKTTENSLPPVTAELNSAALDRETGALAAAALPLSSMTINDNPLEEIKTEQKQSESPKNTQQSAHQDEEKQRPLNNSSFFPHNSRSKKNRRSRNKHSQQEIGKPENGKAANANPPSP